MKDIDILVFVDIIVYGSWDNDKGGWVNRLRLSLENKSEFYFNVYNLGIPGETTVDLKKRFNNECNSRINVNNKTIIIFAIGINDSQIVDGKNTVDIEEFKNNIFELIDKSLNYTKNILFINLTKVDEERVNPIPWDINICYSNKEIVKYNDVLKNICNDKTISYIDVFDLLETKDLNDGLHPNAEGHRKLSEEILRNIQDI